MLRGRTGRDRIYSLQRFPQDHAGNQAGISVALLFRRGRNTLQSAFGPERLGRRAESNVQESEEALFFNRAG